MQGPAQRHSDSAGPTGSCGPASATAAAPPTLPETTHTQTHTISSVSAYCISTNTGEETREASVSDPGGGLLCLLAADELMFPRFVPFCVSTEPPQQSFN